MDSMPIAAAAAAAAAAATTTTTTKNGNTRGRPPLNSVKLHDEEEGDTVGVRGMEAAALCHGSPGASSHKVPGSSRHEIFGSSCHKLFRSGRELSGFGRHEQRGLPTKHQRVVARLGSNSLGTVAAVDERPYACADCSMTFGRETALCGHMKSHKRDHLSSDSEKDADAPTVKRRKKRTSKLRTIKPLEAAWGNHARRNGIPRDAPAEVKISEFDHSGNDISVIVIDDDDDNANHVIAITGSHGVSSLAPDAAAPLAMAPAPAVAVATPTRASHAPTTCVNIEGAPATVSTAAVTIPSAPASAVATTTARAPLATAVSAATQSAPDQVKGNNDSGQAGARYGDNDKAFARNNNNCGKSLAGHGNVEYGNAVAGYSDANNRGKGVSGCTSGSHTNNTSTAARGESNKGCGKVYSCQNCNAFFHTHQALGGHSRHHHKIKEKGNNGSGEAGACIGAILALPAPRAPVHQPPQGTMAMADNPVTGHFSAANTSTSWSLPGTTSSILPAIPLHDQERNPREQMVAGAPSNHGHHSISPELLSFSRRQEIVVVPRNAIASSTSTPRPGIVAATEPSQAVGVNNYYAPIDAPANIMGRRLPFFLAGRSNTQALPLSWPIYHPTQGIAMDGNPLIGHFPATISANGWSFPATTSSVLPSIPLQNQEDGCHSFNPASLSKRQERNPLEEILVGPRNAITSRTPTPHPSGAHITEPYQSITEVNSNAAAIDALANAMTCLPFFQTGRSPIQAPPMSMPMHQPTQGIAAIVGNPVIGHFSAAMAGNGCSFPATTNRVHPTICLQTQEENPPQGRVVPVNELADPSQNQVENPLERTVPGNKRDRTILLFGKNIAKGPKEAEEPRN